MLKIDKIDDENIRIRQDLTDVNVAAIFFAAVSEGGMITLFPKTPNAYRTFSDTAVEIDGESVSGKSPDEIVSELNSFVGNFLKGGTSSENNGDLADKLELLQLKMSPHKWVAGTVYDFGDGSFGQLFHAIIVNDANGICNVDLGIPDTRAILNYGGIVGMWANQQNAAVVPGQQNTPYVNATKDRHSEIIVTSHSWHLVISNADGNNSFTIWVIYS